MRRMLIVSLCLATPAVAQTSAQQDIPIPERVVTATRIPTLAEQIPAGVTIITRETIEQRGFTTLADALQTVPGVGIVQSGGPGSQTSVFIRGTNSNHVLVLRDGIPVNDPSSPAGAFDFGPDTLADVERIEVIRGPMSSLYGSGAIGGVINLISRKGSGAPHGTIELGYGLPRQNLANGTLSGRTGPFDYAIQAGTQADVGFDTTPKRETGIYNGSRNGFSAQTVSVNLGYTPVDGTRIFIVARDRQASSNLDTLGFDPRHYTSTDDSATGQIGVSSHLFHDALETTLLYAATRGDRHYIEPLEAADPNANQADSKYRATRTTLQWNNILHLPDLGPATDTQAIFGYEHVLDQIRVSQNSSYQGFPYQQATAASAASDAGHFGLQTMLFHRLTLTADGRQEDGRYGGGAFTWRTGGVLAVDELLSRFKASYGSAFRAPSLFDLFGTDSYNFQGNPNLRPERSTGYELGWAIDLPFANQPKAASVDITYFNNRIRDLIAFQYAPDFSSSSEVNIGRARTEGIETSLTLRPASWLEATLSYTYTEARNTADNTRLLRRPKNRASLSAAITPLPNLTISPEITISGPFQDYLVDNTGTSTSIGRAKGGTTANLAVTYAITPNLTAFTTARNIGNSKLEPAQGFQTPGPSLLAGLRARF